jgi:hypothetical protein
MRWLLAVLLLLPFTAEAAVLASVTAGDVTVVLTDERCKIPVPPGLDKYLDRHTTWTEKAKVYKGCWGYHPQSADHILMYYEDNTGGAVHKNQFQWAPKA